MKFVFMAYQGTTPLPGSEQLNALSDTEQKASYAICVGGAARCAPHAAASSQERYESPSV
jgi:hypothetical protein